MLKDMIEKEDNLMSTLKDKTVTMAHMEQEVVRPLN